MKQYQIVLIVIVSFLACSCARSGSVNTLNAADTVRQYLDEITVLRDLVYKDLPTGDMVKITKESAQYLKAKKEILSLIWDSGNTRADKFRKNTFTIKGHLDIPDIILENVFQHEFVHFKT